MIQFNINQKPLSVNEAYRGRRFRTKAYIEFERCMLLKMPKGKVDPEQMLRVELFFGAKSRNKIWKLFILESIKENKNLDKLI